MSLYIRYIYIIASHLFNSPSFWQSYQLPCQSSCYLAPGFLQFYPGWFQCWPNSSSTETLEHAARIVARKHKHDHISPFLSELHWLPLSSRIKFKFCDVVYNHFEGILPQYLSSNLKYTTLLAAYIHLLTNFLSCLVSNLNLLVNVLSAILLLLSGTLFPNLFVSHLLWLNSKRT